jgi:hypothetical protein
MKTGLAGRATSGSTFGTPGACSRTRLGLAYVRCTASRIFYTFNETEM